MGKKVLIVDDSRTARQQVKNALTDAGYDIVEAVDGNEGLQLLACTPDVALVLCDVNMPGLNGIDMLKNAQPKHGSNTHFLMLTTEAEPALVQTAKLAGAKGWIVKPFKPELLLASVRKLIGEP